MPALLDKRLIFVGGKGGVGKTTVSAALGLAAARRGKRTIVCEVAGQGRLPAAFRDGEGGPNAAATPDGAADGFREVELAPNLQAISIEPQRALEEYLSWQVGSRALSRLLFHNRVFQYLAAAAPGLKELVTIGKVWELAQPERKVAKASRYDLVIVDAPATGHGLGILRTPRTFRDVARVGPVRRQAERIHSFIVDAAVTGVVVVALPEEMPVNETLDFRRSLGEQMGMAVDAIVVNALYPDRFRGAEAERLAELAERDGDPASPAVRAALRAALTEHRRARAQRAQLRRLKKEAGDAEVATLPFLFDPDLGPEAFDRLSRQLERKL